VYSSWPVEIRPIGLAACGTVVWRFRGQLRVTAIVKATFSLVPGGAMELEDPDDIHVAEVHHDGDPAASLWAGSDLAPFRLLADIVAVGHAYVPPSGGAVRLGVFHERTALVDKSIQVAVDDTASSGAPEPVPLRYERAFGGKNSSTNPVGTGRSARSPLPNLIDAGDPRRAIGFGPIARSWPSRRRLLGELELGALEQEVVEVPSKFDWAYFQAAPPGQVVDFLRGDEWIVLEGMHPEHPVLQTYLPGPVGAGRIYGLGEVDGPPVPIAFRADNLHIDADRGRCSLTWRASFSVPDEEVLSRLIVLAGVEFAGYPIAWPDAARIQHHVSEPPVEEISIDVVEEDPEFGVSTIALALDEAPPPPAPAEAGTRRQSTVLLAWNEGGPPGAPEAPPAASNDPGLPGASPRQSTVVLAWSEGVVPQPLPPPPARPRQATMHLEWDQGVAPDASRLMPFAVAAQAENLDDSPLMGTMALTDEQAATPMPMLSPFRLAAPGSPPSEPHGDIPGAPWARTLAPVVPRPLMSEVTRSQVLREALTLPDDLLEPEAPTGKLQVKETIAAEPAPPAAEPPKPPETTKERAWSWATVAEPPRAAPSAPRAPRPIPKPVVKNSLYGRFSPPKK
jgi:hypothetical protein